MARLGVAYSDLELVDFALLLSSLLIFGT